MGKRPGRLSPASSVDSKQAAKKAKKRIEKSKTGAQLPHELSPTSSVDSNKAAKKAKKKIRDLGAQVAKLLQAASQNTRELELKQQALELTQQALVAKQEALVAKKEALVAKKETTRLALTAISDGLKRELQAINELTRYKAQMQHRILMESHISELHQLKVRQRKGVSNTAKWKWFRNTYLLKSDWSFTDMAEKALTSLEVTRRQRNVVVRDMDGDFYSTISQPHHSTASMPGTGWVTGGQDSPGLAASVAIGILLAVCSNNNINLVHRDVSHVNADFKRTHTFDFKNFEWRAVAA